MARYLYAGDAFGAAREAGGRIDTTSAARGGTGVALLCDLLRVADAWCLDHLKSACEVRLAACIVDAADAALRERTNFSIFRTCVTFTLLLIHNVFNFSLMKCL